MSRSLLSIESEPEFLSSEFLAPAADQSGRRRDVRFYSGARIERKDFWTGEKHFLTFSMEPKDVKLGLLNAGAPVFKQHVPLLDFQIGVTEKAWLDGKNAYATLRFQENDEQADMVWNKIEQGIVRSISMGVRLGALDDITPAAKKEGERVPKEYLARGWEPFEISPVPIAADPKAKILAAELSADPEFARYLQKHFGGSMFADRDRLNAALEIALALNRNRQRAKE